MELSFWQSKWEKGQTGFHMEKVYPPLMQHIDSIPLPEDANILVPLCGKSHDLYWLRNQGYNVIGVEVSPIALKHIRDQNSEPFSHYQKGSFKIFKCSRLQLWQGDFMKLKLSWLPSIHLVYDKAALIALPPLQRVYYAHKVEQILSSGHGRLFQQTFEYEQTEMEGPPFSVPQSELEDHYGPNFNIELLMEKDAPELLERFQKRGMKSYLEEKIFHIYPKNQ